MSWKSNNCDPRTKHNYNKRTIHHITSKKIPNHITSFRCLSFRLGDASSSSLEDPDKNGEDKKNGMFSFVFTIIYCCSVISRYYRPYYCTVNPDKNMIDCLWIRMLLFFMFITCTRQNLIISFFKTEKNSGVELNMWVWCRETSEFSLWMPFR